MRTVYPAHPCVINLIARRGVQIKEIHVMEYCATSLVYSHITFMLLSSCSSFKIEIPNYKLAYRNRKCNLIFYFQRRREHKIF